MRAVLGQARQGVGKSAWSGRQVSLYARRRGLCPQQQGARGWQRWGDGALERTVIWGPE
jgi:hypothetical protein